MQIQTSKTISKLSAQSKDDLIAEITKAVAEQQASSDRLEQAAKRANQGKVLLSAVGVVIGLLVGIGGSFIFLNDELRAWKAVKHLHDASGENSILFDHSGLALPDLSQIALKSDLPDMEMYALKEDVPPPIDVSEFAKTTDIPNVADVLRVGDRITLQGVSGKYLFDYDARNTDELDVLMGSSQEWRINSAN